MTGQSVAFSPILTVEPPPLEGRSIRISHTSKTRWREDCIQVRGHHNLSPAQLKLIKVCTALNMIQNGQLRSSMAEAIVARDRVVMRQTKKVQMS